MAKRNVAPRAAKLDELAVRRLAKAIEKKCGGDLANLQPETEKDREIRYREEVYQKAADKLEELGAAYRERQKAEREWTLAQPNVMEFPPSRVRRWEVQNAIKEAFQSILQQDPDLEPRTAWRYAMSEAT